VVDLFPLERAALLELLHSLDARAWGSATVCPGWAVRDIAAHLVADDLGRLSRQRDGHRSQVRRDDEDLASFVDRLNAEWVVAMRRISPTIITSLLELGGRETRHHFSSLHPLAIGGPVSWATGERPAPVWLDLARELTERWHHQQQIRDATGAPPLTEPRPMRAVLATFARALPRTLEDTERVDGAAATMIVTGDSGVTWTVLRGNGRWQLYAGRAHSAIAEVEVAQDDFWRLVTKGITPAMAERRSRLAGDLDVARQLLRTVAIIG
jgi:uncharacterized protein (TIGR03083 family)